VGRSAGGQIASRQAGSKIRLKKAALSLGERVSDDGVFISRRRTGEGFLLFPS
jgi:hypothetical protein